MSKESKLPPLTLRCIDGVRINKTYSEDYDLHVITPKAVPVSHYELMCGAIHSLRHDQYVEAVLKEIQEVERGTKDVVEEVTEAEAYIFWLTRGGVSFEFKYGESGPEKGGEVTLAQFKLAVQTYLQFLRDPERRPIEVPFPD